MDSARGARQDHSVSCARTEVGVDELSPGAAAGVGSK